MKKNNFILSYLILGIIFGLVLSPYVANTQTIITLNAGNETLPAFEMTLTEAASFNHTFELQAPAGGSLSNNITWAIPSCTPPPDPCSPTHSLTQVAPGEYTFNNTNFTLNIPTGIVANTATAEISVNGATLETGQDEFTFRITDTSSGVSKDVTVTVTILRQPVSVVFVLDRSGSMGWLPHGAAPGATTTRMEILKTAATLFVNKLDAINITGDEVALTYFNSSVDNPPPAFAPTLTDLDGNAISFNGDINAQVPGGGTDMGGGLIAAKTKLNSAGLGHEQFIFLFTDGEQNGSNLVNDTGTSVNGTSLNNATNSIQIVTIGTGAAAMSAAANRLQAIAEQNTGVSPSTDGIARYFLLQEEVDPDGVGGDFNALTSISNFFDEGFQDMVAAASPQTVGIKRGIMPQGQAVSVEFDVNANIDRLIFELITQDQEPSFVIQKDGQSIEAQDQTAISYRFERNSRLAIVNISPFSSLKSQGKWQLIYRSGTGGGLPYQLKAQVDDHRMDYTFEVTADTFKVGTTLDLSANLSYDNRPIEDATITTTVFKPGEDLGDLLAKLNLGVDLLNLDIDIPGLDSLDDSSVGYKKLLLALEKNPQLMQKLQQQLNTVNLSHTGNGQYEGNYSNTNVTGVYQVLTRISGNIDSIGDYERLIRRTVYLRFGDINPVLSRTTNLVVDSTKNTVQFTYTPMFKVGNLPRFVGPGFASGINVSGSNDISLSSVTDNGNGSYDILLTGNPDANITLSISNVSVYQGTAQKCCFPSPPADCEGFECSQICQILKGIGLPCNAFWIFIALIVILIAVFIRRLTKKKND